MLRHLFYHIFTHTLYVFTLKSGLIVTFYLGATAVEVSEVLKAKIQRMDEVGFIASNNTPGLFVIEVTIRDTFGGDALPKVWGESSTANATR